MSTPKRSNVLSGFPERLLSELFEDAVAHKLRDGEVLFRAGDVGDGCYRIQRGLVKVVVTSQKREERIISLLGPDAIVGELSMIDAGPPPPRWSLSLTVRYRFSAGPGFRRTLRPIRRLQVT